MTISKKFLIIAIVSLVAFGSLFGGKSNPSVAPETADSMGGRSVERSPIDLQRETSDSMQNQDRSSSSFSLPFLTAESIFEFIGYDSMEDFRAHVEAGELDEEIASMLENQDFIDGASKVLAASKEEMENIRNRERTSLDFGESIYESKWQPILQSLNLDGRKMRRLKDLIVSYEAKVDEFYDLATQGEISFDSAFEESDSAKLVLDSELESQLSPSQLEEVDRQLARRSKNLAAEREKYWQTQAEMGVTDVMLYASRPNSGTDITALIAGGTDVNAVDQQNGSTALTLATSTENVENMRALIEAGANVDHRDSYGFTALYLAVSRGNVEAVRMLVDAGASKDIPTNTGLTAVDQARFLDSSDVASREIVAILSEQ